MGSQQELFHEPSQVLTPSIDRLDPAIWVKRLVIWEDKEKVIRDIPLRRGLNIIWSPDPGSDDAVLGQSSGSGHGAGKTLFCRLIRYCLGEDRFANEELRHAIAQNLPQGIVGAEVMVGDTQWSVVRPIGITRKHWAVSDQALEDVIADDPPATGITPLIDAISTLNFPIDLESTLPGTSSNKAWLYALGWLSRDQECRFDHLLDWRHTDAKTDSPLLGLGKDDILLAVRLYLNLISGEEMEARKQRDNLPNEDQIKRNIDYHQRTIERIAKELTESLGVTPITDTTDPLSLNTYEKAASTNLAATKEAAPSIILSDDLKRRQSRLDNLIGQEALLNENIRQADARSSLQDKHVASLNSEHGKLNGDALKAEFGDICPICNVSIDMALAEGCKLSHKLMDVDKIEGDKSRIQNDIDNCINAKAIYDKQKKRYQAEVGSVVTEMGSLRKAINEETQKNRQAQDVHLKKQFHAEQLVKKGKQLSTFLDEKTKQEKALINRASDSEKITKQLTKLRGKHQAAMTRLNDLFSYVAKAVLKGNTSASITLTEKRLIDSVSLGGAAMTSFKAVIFDLAALMLTIEGKSHLPAFLLHDSPREADLGISYYHKPFLLMKKLEGLAPEPPFQYIITTTTEPPRDLIDSECHILTLDGSDPEERLLKRDLLGFGT